MTMLDEHLVVEHGCHDCDNDAYDGTCDIPDDEHVYDENGICIDWILKNVTT